MKIKAKTCIVGMAALISLTIGAHASDILSFSDVPKTDWAYPAIMDMVNRGMFNGVKPPKNGVGEFAPKNYMSRAELVTVLTRYLFPNELAEMVIDSNVPWYQNNYIVSLNHGLLSENEFDHGDLKKTCTRQEMSMLLTRAAKIANDETPRQLILETSIADFNNVDAYYKDYVLSAYSMGLLTGVDNMGTFLPTSSLTRAQGAMVIYRLLEPTTRNIIYFNEIGEFTTSDGVVYLGEHINGEANGYGKMTFPGVGIYEGYFTDGQREGVGTFEWDVGDRYVGSWHQDSMNGNGTYTFADGYTIRGLWENNNIKN